MKDCPQCGSAGPFYANDSYCKSCRKAQASAWKAANRERALEINRDSEKRWRAKQPKTVQAMPCVIDGVEYPSQATAAKALGIHYRKIAALADPREGYDIDF